ncbi:MAG: hypothetical protein R3284_05545 [Rubricoccaceae bacterium]|nr:hypothetical protein [Rubricoccaceae bacterium]
MTRYTLLLLLPLALGCGGDDSDDSYSTAGDVSGIDSPSLNLMGEECLAGTWQMDVGESFNLEYINDMIGEQGGGVEMEFGGHTGDAQLRITDDGNAEYLMDNLAITINATSPVGEMVTTNTMNGTSSATFTVEGDQLHFTPGEADLTSNVQVEMGGNQMMNSSVDVESLFESAERSMMTFECTGDVLLLDIYETDEGGRLMFKDTRYTRMR